MDEDLRHQLDQDLESLRSLLFTVDEANLSSAIENPDPEDQEYNKAVRELAFEQRAKPKDRTKTEEELALEEKRALERAERKRQRRMLGEDSDSEDENGRRKRLKQIGGDDLEDDFYGEAGFGTGLQEEGDESDQGGGEDEDEEPLGDEDDDDVRSPAKDIGSVDEGDETEPPLRRQGNVRGLVAEELPYTFPCPGSHEQFLNILKDVKDEDISTVVHRIRTLHHPSLAEGNKLKLQVIPTLLVCTLR